MKIAVIGSGISGLSAAYFLSKKHKVDLFEKEDHFGGHSYTYDINSNGKIISVDLGFIVFNDLTYPNLIKFFEELNVPFGFKLNGFITTKSSGGYKKNYSESNGNPNEFLGKRKDLTPNKIYQITKKFKESGATIIGGCCEIGPAHTEAMAKLK